MILISEWLPNPVGSDAEKEWVELWNDGPEAAVLTGWRLTTDGKKFFGLEGVLPAGARAVVRRSESKLTLRNIDGRIALYDPQGRLADQAGFHGGAPEGASANRVGKEVFFAAPTPGAANSKEAAPQMPVEPGDRHPAGAPLGPPANAALYFSAALLSTALALAVAVVFILKSYENLSQLFFPGDSLPRSARRA